ncbi:MAG: flavodoxin domain-containing protein [Huintestinicola sp.]
MAKTAVLYKTRFGCSKTYADYIAKALKADIYEADKVKEEKLIPYSTIVMCGGVYNDEWSCAKPLGRFRNLFSGKNLVLLMSVWNDAPEKLSSAELKSEYLNGIVISPDKIFAVKGSIDKSKLTFGDKLTLKSRKKKIQSKEAKTNNDFSILGIIDGYSGGADTSSADPIIEYIKTLNG